MITYKVIKDNPLTLIKLLEEYYYSHSYELFIELREQDSIYLNKVEIAGRLIYLNKASYGGIYRVNKDGEGNFSWVDWQPKTCCITH